jgi:hypothetical protein
MAKKPKRLEPPISKHWCECERSNCDIGAHERCPSPKCHMPKWKGGGSERKSSKK